MTKETKAPLLARELAFALYLSLIMDRSWPLVRALACVFVRRPLSAGGGAVAVAVLVVAAGLGLAATFAKEVALPYLSINVQPGEGGRWARSFGTLFMRSMAPEVVGAAVVALMVVTLVDGFH